MSLIDYMAWSYEAKYGKFPDEDYWKQPLKDIVGELVDDDVREEIDQRVAEERGEDMVGNGLWYNRKEPKRVYARRIQKREAITVHREGYETAKDTSTTYIHGDYIVYDETKGIYFMKEADFKKEFDADIV